MDQSKDLPFELTGTFNRYIEITIRNISDTLYNKELRMINAIQKEAAPKDKFNIGAAPVLIDQSCSDNSIDYVQIFGFPNVCGADDYEFKLQITDGVHSYEQQFWLNIDDTDFISLSDRVYLSDIDAYKGNLKNSALYLYYKEAGVEYGIDTLQLYYLVLEPLKPQEIINFNDDNIDYRIRIQNSFFGQDTTIENNRLKISTEWSSNGSLECFGDDDAIEGELTNVFGDLTYINICGDLKSMSKPVLSFDLEQTSKNPGQNFVIVEQDKVKMNPYIYGKNNGIFNYQYDLKPKQDNSEIILTSKVYYGFPAYFDNITIFDRATNSDDYARSLVKFTNPSYESIHFFDIDQDISVEISDGQGRTIKSTNITSSDNTIDVATLPSGMYILKFTTNGSISYDKIIIVD